MPMIAGPIDASDGMAKAIHDVLIDPSHATVIGVIDGPGLKALAHAIAAGVVEYIHLNADIALSAAGTGGRIA